MNRRSLLRAALGVLSLGLLPRKPKPTKEELNRALNLAVNKEIQDHPERWLATLYPDGWTWRGGAGVELKPPELCTFRPGCTFPAGSFCGLCPIKWTCTVLNYDPGVRLGPLDATDDPATDFTSTPIEIIPSWGTRPSGGSRRP